MRSASEVERVGPTFVVVSFAMMVISLPLSSAVMGLVGSAFLAAVAGVSMPLIPFLMFFNWCYSGASK